MAAASCLGLVPLLPGVRDYAGYAALGEGFCYWDLNAKPVAVITLVLTAVLISATLVLNGRALYHLWNGGVQEPAKYGTLLALMLVTAVTWVLWPVASIFTLSGNPFPPGMMIAGGILGHSQALVNPLLYGLFWRRSFLSTDSEAGKCNDVKAWADKVACDDVKNSTQSTVDGA